jgi:integrase
MPSVTKEKGAWVAKWKNAAGRWQRQRTSCGTKAEAKEFARRLEHLADQQRRGLAPVEQPSSMTFGDLMAWHDEQFGALKRSNSDRLLARKHLTALERLPLVEVTPARIDEVLTAKTDVLAPKTLNNLRAWIQGVFAKAIQRQVWTRANPADAVPRRTVPKRMPSYLKPDEVQAMLAQLPETWRGFFATAVYTGMRRGEVVGLQRRDVDLEAGTIVVTRSWDSDTTKGRRARLLPIHPELRPYLVAAMEASTSALVFARPDGAMQSTHAHLPRLLRSALNSAGLVDGWVMKCRRCSHRETSKTSEPKRCPECGFKLWASPVPRRVRFHDLRHTTATLMLKSGASLAVVQRMLGHTDPNVTANTYGHLDLDDLRRGVERLSFGGVVEAEAPPAEVLPLAVNGSPDAEIERRGLPVAHGLSEEGFRTRARAENHQRSRAVEANGPTRIRTWNQAVMSRQLCR